MIHNALLLLLCSCLYALAGTAHMPAADTASAVEPSHLASARAAWQQNRPAEALPTLYAHAQQTQTWYDFYDLGRAAYDAGQQGAATAWLLTAHHLAPEQALPLQALRTMNSHLPAGYLEQLGPLALPGIGFVGLLCMTLIGFFGVVAIVIPQRRYGACMLASIIAIISLPGLLAYTLDSHQHYVACVRNTALLDSSGNRLQSLTEATILSVISRTTDSRILVHLHNEKRTRGYINASDCLAQP